MGDCTDFVETTAKAEYLYNAQNPIEGVYIFFGDKVTQWEVIMFLEAGYLHDLCVEFTVTFPMNYPDQPVDVVFQHDIVHPHIMGTKSSRFGDYDQIRSMADEDSGRFFVQDLIDWNPLDHCTVHVLAAIKSMLFQPLEQPKILTEKSLSRVRNKEALKELLESQRCFQSWRERYIKSQINLTNKKRLSSRQDSARAQMGVDDDKRNKLSYNNSLDLGGLYPNKRRSSIGMAEEPSLDLVVPSSLKPYVADAINLEEISAQIDTHVGIMLKRLQADENVGLLHIVSERVDVIHADLQALLKR